MRMRQSRMVTRYSITHLKRTSSTNDFLKKRCSSLPSLSTAVAETQTAGRGRFRRKWKSEKGGLWFSILAKHRYPDKSHLLGFAAAVCVAEELRSRGVDAEIKWPNDVLVKGKKICGILMENIISGEMTNTIIGVGVNLNNSRPLRTATTFELETGKKCSIEGFFKAFLDRYRKMLDAYSQKRYTAVLDRWNVLWGAKGKTLRISTIHGMVKGTAEKIDNDGQLIIKSGRKKTTVNEGDIS
jgi:BirA family biotin operon repressor/biotin-[acetyl-CoA-carboxylase] ligase